MGEIVCVVGKSGSGKTRLVGKMVRELSRRGWSVATVKHSDHRFSFEPQGKDTVKHRRAGAKTVLFLGPGETVIVRPPGEDLPVSVARYCRDADIVIAEGFTGENYSKIVIVRDKEEKSGLKTLSNVCAIVADKRLTLTEKAEKSGLERFGPDDVKRISDFVEKRFISKKHRLRTVVVVNGKEIGVKGFVQEFLGRGILGMVGVLKGTDGVRTTEIIVTRQ